MSRNIVLLFGLFLLALPTPSVDGQLIWRKLDRFFASNGAPSPPPRKDMAIGYDSSRRFLVIFGGAGEGGRPFRDTWVLDVVANRWYNATAPDGPEARFGMISGVSQGEFYISTGCNHSSYCFSDTWGFHTGNFSWRRVEVLGDMVPVGRSGAAGGIFPASSTLFLSGGFSSARSFLPDTLMFDLISRRWYQLEGWQSTYDPSSPHPRAFHAFAMIGPSRLLIFGGCVRHGPCPSSDSWVFHAQSKLWSKLDLCTLARSRAKMALFPPSDAQRESEFVVLFGGENSGWQVLGIQNIITPQEIVLLHLPSLKWSRRRVLGETPDARHSFGFVATPAGIFLFGGQNASGKILQDLWILTGSPDATQTFRDCERSQFTLISLHALFMFLSFGFLLQLGAFLAQYASSLDTVTFNWIYLHRTVQSIGLVLATAGLICAVLLVHGSGQHFKSVHAIVGLTLFTQLLLQPLLALLSKYFSSGITTELLLRVHFWNGLGILLLSFVNISLGLFLAMAFPGIWISWFAYVVVLLISFSIIQTTDCCANLFGNEDF